MKSTNHVWGRIGALAACFVFVGAVVAQDKSPVGTSYSKPGRPGIDKLKVCDDLGRCEFFGDLVGTTRGAAAISSPKSSPLRAANRADSVGTTRGAAAISSPKSVHPSAGNRYFYSFSGFNQCLDIKPFTVSSPRDVIEDQGVQVPLGSNTLEITVGGQARLRGNANDGSVSLEQARSAHAIVVGLWVRQSDPGAPWVLGDDFRGFSQLAAYNSSFAVQQAANINPIFNVEDILADASGPEAIDFRITAWPVTGGFRTPDASDTNIARLFCDPEMIISF